MQFGKPILWFIIASAILFCSSHAWIRGMGVRNDGHLMVADSNGDLLRFRPSGRLRSTQEFEPGIRTFNMGNKNKLYLTLEKTEDRLQLFSPKADLLKSFPIAGEFSVRITPGSPLVLTFDNFHKRVSVYKRSGKLIASTEGFYGLSDMASDSEGRVYLSFWNDNHIHVYTKKLAFIKKWGGSLPLISVDSIYLDTYTNRMYITDGDNKGVHVYNRKKGKHVFSLDQSLFYDPGEVVVTPKRDSLKRFIFVYDQRREDSSSVYHDVLKFKHKGKFVKRFNVAD